MGNQDRNRNRNQPKETKMENQDQQQDTTLTPPAVQGEGDQPKDPVETIAQDQTKPAEAPTAAPEPTPVVKVDGTENQPDLNSAFQLPQTASAHSVMLISELKSYIDAVSLDKNYDPDRGGQAQTLLYHALLQIINSKAEEFKDVFGLALKIIAANQGEKGVFNFMNMHRYTTHVTLSGSQTAHFRTLMNLLSTAAAPNTRQSALRQVDVEKALKVNSIKEEARQRVLAFFHVQ